MTDSANWLRANVPTIAAEEIDGEIVVVSFDTGHYYSLRDTAADIWLLLDGGSTVESVIEAVNGDDPISRSVIEEFIAALQSEGLMVGSAPDGGVAPPTARTVGPYSAPKLERFEEMSQMLLYDPIHDVDDTGWPNLPDGAGEQS